MSNFWKTLKPAPKTVTATNLDLSDDSQVLRVQWDDGKQTSVRAQALRQMCPCAECVDEWTHQRTLDVSKVPADTKILEAHAVGNYAISFVFSDAHRTGIFQWPYLRELTEKFPA